jgi:hypothetical protein
VSGVCCVAVLGRCVCLSVCAAGMDGLGRCVSCLTGYVDNVIYGYGDRGIGGSSGLRVLWIVCGGRSVRRGGIGRDTARSDRSDRSDRTGWIDKAVWLCDLDWLNR